MSKIRVVAMSALAALVASAGVVRAEDVSAKKIQIKDHLTKPEKRQIQVQSADLGITPADVGDPGTNGASLHVYSATDDFCATLPAGAEWKVKNDKWTYKSKVTKNSAQVKAGKLLVKIKSGVTFTLADNTTQGTVNAQVQFGTGTRFCLKCPGNKKDEATKFLGKDCVAAPCDAEPPSCDPPGTTTTTSTTSAPTTTGAPGTTTTSTIPSGGVVLQGVLPSTTGLFNFTPGEPGIGGANTRCNVEFPGTHACTHAELLDAETAGDLVGIQSINGQTPTSFWLIDATHANNLQCNETLAGPPARWEYATVHTGVGGERLAFTAATGDLGATTSGLICFNSSWVGCCL